MAQYIEEEKNQELIKLQLNIALYTLDVIRKYLLEPKEQNKDLEKIGNQINADIITNFFNILCQNDIDSQIICLNNMKELYIRKLDPMYCSLPGSSVLGNFQARILE